MIRRLLAAGLLVAALPLGARAQVSKFNWGLNTGAMIFKSRGPMPAFNPSLSDPTTTYDLETHNDVVLHIGVSIGFDAPLYSFNDDMAAGVSLNASLGALRSQKIEGANTLIIDLPQYLTWRYGAKATKHSDRVFGVGVGAGYRYAYTFLPYRSPSLMLEGVHSTSRNDWYLRLAVDARKTQLYNHYSSEGLVPVISMRQLMLQFGCSF